MSDGQLALNTNLVSPGLFFKDSNGDSVKIGPVHVGTTAPNVTPGAGGQAGNSKGEQWLDTSSSRYVFKIWDGTAWRSEDGEFVNASGDTMTGALVMDNQQQVQFRETTANGTNSIALQAPAAVASDRTLTLPDVTGTIVSTGDTGSVTSTMILDGTILNADINASAAIADTKLATISTAGKVSGTAITSGNINTSGEFRITNVSPTVRLAESDGTATHSQTVLARADNLFQLQTRSSTGVYLSTDYFIPANASGATDHIWRIANTEKLSLDSTGLTVVNDLTISDKIIHAGDTDTAIRFPAADTVTVETAGAERARINSAGLSLAGYVQTNRIQNVEVNEAIVLEPSNDSIQFTTNSVERMRINSGGAILIGQSTTSTPGVGNNTVGIGLDPSGTGCFSRAAVGLRVNRTADGAVVAFSSAGTEEGNISISGTTTSYNGAHLSRWSQLSNNAERIEILRGSVLSNIDEMCEWGEEDNEQLNRMKVSDVEGDKNVSGVFQDWDDDDETYTDDFYCAMTGDFIIRIAEGVTVERGDLLMSAGDGTAKPQDDDIIRSKTIAKVTSTNVSCTYADGSYCVPCVLMAC